MRPMLRVLSCVAVISFSFSIFAVEESIPVDKLPKAVLETVKKRFPKAEIVEAEKSTEDNEEEYVVSIKDGKTEIDVTLTPDGKITLIEKEIPVKDLPKAVADALAAKFQKATIKTAYEVTTVTDGKEELDYYDVVVVTADKKTLDVEVTPDGKIEQVEEHKEEKKEEPKKQEKKKK